MKRATVADMHRHFFNLVEKYEIHVKICCRPRQGSANRPERFVRVPFIRSDLSYLVAMHELGHILGFRQGSRRIVMREVGAWKWAYAKAIVWTPRMDKFATKALEGYAADPYSRQMRNRRTIDPQIIQLKAEGMGPSQIAKKLGIGRAWVYRVLETR